jgi:hypothetical protein
MRQLFTLHMSTPWLTHTSAWHLISTPRQLVYTSSIKILELFKIAWWKASVGVTKFSLTFSCFRMPWLKNYAFLDLCCYKLFLLYTYEELIPEVKRCNSEIVSYLCIHTYLVKYSISVTLEAKKSTLYWNLINYARWLVLFYQIQGVKEQQKM